MPGAGGGESKESSKKYESQTVGSDPGLVGLAQLMSRTLSSGKVLLAPLSLLPPQDSWDCSEVSGSQHALRYLLIQQLPTQCPQ